MDIIPYADAANKGRTRTSTCRAFTEGEFASVQADARVWCAEFIYSLERGVTEDFNPTPIDARSTWIQLMKTTRPHVRRVVDVRDTNASSRVAPIDLKRCWWCRCILGAPSYAASEDFYIGEKATKSDATTNFKNQRRESAPKHEAHIVRFPT